MHNLVDLYIYTLSHNTVDAPSQSLSIRNIRKKHLHPAILFLVCSYNMMYAASAALAASMTIMLEILFVSCK